MARELHLAGQFAPLKGFTEPEPATEEDLLLVHHAVFQTNIDIRGRFELRIDIGESLV